MVQEQARRDSSARLSNSKVQKALEEEIKDVQEVRQASRQLIRSKRRSPF